MTDRAASPVRTLASDDGPPAARGEWMSAPTRELAQRRSGTVEVLLLWHPRTNRVELSVRESPTGGGFQTVVEPGDAIDAFYHPYAYAPRHEGSYRVHGAEPTIIDG